MDTICKDHTADIPPITDPIWGYVMEVARKWGTDRPDFIGPKVSTAQYFLDHARSYEDRDKIEAVFHQVVALRPADGWALVKWGGMPGGAPYAESLVKTYTSDMKEDIEWTVTFGALEDPDTMIGKDCYVQMMDYEKGDMHFVFLTWSEFTADRIVGWVEHFRSLIGVNY